MKPVSLSRGNKRVWVKSLSSMEPWLALLAFGTIRLSLGGAEGLQAGVAVAWGRAAACGLGLAFDVLRT